MQKYFIGIDIGTGSTKAVALDISGKSICTAQRYYPTLNPQPGYSEQNPRQIWEAFISSLNQVVNQMHAPPQAIGFSSAMHSLIAVDDNGDALANMIIWSDSRSSAIAASLRSSADGEDMYRHTGTPVYAMSPLCKLIWLQQHNTELFNKSYKFISVKEYIWFKLFSVFEVDYSLASATGLFDILTLKWYEKACTLASVTANRLSEPVDTGHVRHLKASHSSLPGLDTSVAFITGASDGCCASLSGNAIRGGVAALTIGTSGAVRAGSNKPVYNYNAMTFNYLLNKDTFICGGAVNNGGSAVDWLLKDFLKQDNIARVNYDQLFKEIDTVAAGSEGLIFLPYLYGERAPIWDAKSSGAFLNINFKHRQQHFLRAALEGICFALYDVLNAVESSPVPVREIVVSGGFISSPVWLQILADITGKKLVVLQEEDSSAIGAAFLAMQALKINLQPIYDNKAESRVVIDPHNYNHQVYSKVFLLYKKAYTALKPCMHERYDLNY